MTQKNTANAKNSSVRKGLNGLFIAISEYVATIDEMFSSTIATEHTYREALTKMLRALLPGMDVWNEPKQIDCGALDCIILKDKLPVAFVEAKKVGTGDLDGKKTTGNKEQFDRYKANVTNAAKVRTLADAEGVTMSVWVARLVHEAVRKAKASPNAKAWAAERLAVNTARRARVDAAVHAGRDRKPGWKLTKRFAGKGDSRRGA